MNTRDEIHPYFEVSAPFLHALKIAKEDGLEYEVMAEFFKNLKVSKEQMHEAMHHAMMEWVYK